MTQVYYCEKCRTPIAVGTIEAGALQIKCKRCGYKTLVIPPAAEFTRIRTVAQITASARG